jgi:hypothetical protein
MGELKDQFEPLSTKEKDDDSKLGLEDSDPSQEKLTMEELVDK